jgi:hypothetical protein
MICIKCSEEKEYEEFSKNIEGVRCDVCLECAIKNNFSSKNAKPKLEWSYPCTLCGENIEILSSTDRVRPRKNCSKCILKFGHWRFQGREWIRLRVRNRDNFTCQHCGEVWQKGTRQFDVHHLYELGASRKYDIEEDMSKLITLCHRCHMDLHYKYRGEGEVGLIPLSLFSKHIKKYGC